MQQLPSSWPKMRRVNCARVHLLACMLTSAGDVKACLQVEADLEDRDVDSRVAAVRSLASTLQTLGASQAGAQPLQEPETVQLAELLQQHALPYLLTALQDYSTDNRNSNFKPKHLVRLCGGDGLRCSCRS